MAAGAADMIFGCVFDGSLSMRDMNIERRPYHKNCKCALHKARGQCSHAASLQRNVSFPQREFRNGYSVSVSVSSSALYDQRISSNSSREFFNGFQVDSSCSTEQSQKSLA